MVRRNLVKISGVDEYQQEYAKPKIAAAIFGVSDSTIYELIRRDKVESFLLKDEPDSRMGARLVSLASVRAYFAAETLKEQKAKAARGSSPVAANGRAVMAANRARRRAEKQKETAGAELLQFDRACGLSPRENLCTEAEMVTIRAQKNHDLRK